MDTIEEERGFGEPQRQSRIGILVEFAYTLQRMIRSFWPALLYFFIRFKEANWLYIGLGTIIVLVLVGVVAYLKYLNLTFHIDEERKEFILNRGIINKKRVVVQLSKIQQVNINQSFIQKLADVYAVEIETAGSAKSEATMRAISKTVALALKMRLMEMPSEGEAYEHKIRSGMEDENPINTSSPFIKIGLPSLLKIGVTSNYIESFMLLLAFIYAIYSNVKDVWWNDGDGENQLRNVLGSFMVLQSILIVFGILVILTFLVNLVRTVIPYFDFRISKQGRSLLLSYGLFNSKNTILQPQKVQVVKLISNYFQRRMNVLRMVVRQASSDVHMDKKASIQIPGCNAQERDSILKLIFQQLPEKGAMLKPNIRKIIGSVGGFIITPLVLYGAVAANNPVAYGYIYLLPVYVMLVSFLIYFSYHNNRLYVQEGFIIKQSGVWDIHTAIIEPYKIQSITTRQNFWHRRNDIGHVVIHTAGGDVVFRFGDFTRIKEYVDMWLYQVESSQKEWM